MSTTIRDIPAPAYPDPEQTYGYSVGCGYGHGGGIVYDYGQLGGGFGGFGNGLSAGSATAAGYRKGNASPDRPAILGWGGNQFVPDGGVTLSKSVDEVLRNLGPAVYDLMREDDAVAPAVAMLVYGVVSGELHVEPAVVPEPGENLDDATDPRRRKDIEESATYADELKRSLNRVPELLGVVEEMLTEGFYNAASLVEPVWESVKEEGDAKPLMLLKSAQVRPRDAWAMIADAYGQINRIAAYTPDGPMVFERDRFWVYVNSPRRGDPRGTVEIRPAYDAWNLKVQARPQRGRWCAQFAVPTVKIRYDAQDAVVTYHKHPDGTDDYNRPMTPAEQAEGVAANVHGGSWMAMPITWDGELIESKGDGGAFGKYEEDLNNAITAAILLSSRTLNEAAHGSKADSETSVGTTMLKIDRKRWSVLRLLERGLCWTQTMMNHGVDAANRLAPKLKFPDPDPNVVEMLKAAVTAGYKFVPRQYASLDAKFGVPVRTAEEIDELHQQDMAAKQASVDAMKAKAGLAGGGADGTEGGDAAGKRGSDKGGKGDAPADGMDGKPAADGKKSPPRDDKADDA
jgi:hypothetical protein